MAIIVAVLLGLVAARTSIDAPQIGYLWSFDELTAKADLVVIAEHVGTADTGRRREHPDLRPAMPVAELESTFDVMTVFKPDVGATSGAIREVRLKHFRPDLEEWRRRKPPQPGFPPPGFVNTGLVLDFAGQRSPYLLFLRRGEAGSYEPVSGHTFPTDSVYLLRKPERSR